MHRIVKPIAKNTLFMLVSIQNDEILSGSNENSFYDPIIQSIIIAH
jgi:hypothetical protein